MHAPGGKYLVVGNLPRYSAIRSAAALKSFPPRQKLKITAINPRLPRITRDPGIVLLDGHTFPERLRMNYLKNRWKSCQERCSETR